MNEHKLPEGLDPKEAELIKLIEEVGSTMTLEQRRGGMKIMVKQATEASRDLLDSLSKEFPDAKATPERQNAIKRLALALGLLGRSLGLKQEDVDEIFPEDQKPGPDLPGSF